MMISVQLISMILKLQQRFVEVIQLQLGGEKELRIE